MGHEFWILFIVATAIVLIINKLWNSATRAADNARQRRKNAMYGSEKSNLADLYGKGIEAGKEKADD